MRLLVLPVLLAVLVGCEGGGPVPADPSYALDVQPVFDVSCIGCHSATAPSGNYPLTSRAGALGGGSDSVPNVMPGHSDSSQLYRRVTGAATPLMPLGGAPLDSVKTGTIRNWINRGAKDN